MMWLDLLCASVPSCELFIYIKFTWLIFPSTETTVKHCSYESLAQILPFKIMAMPVSEKGISVPKLLLIPSYLHTSLKCPRAPADSMLL